MKKSEKVFKEELKFNISFDNKKYNINIKSIDLEEDLTGRIKEKLHLKEGKVSFDQGINDLTTYVKSFS